MGQLVCTGIGSLDGFAHSDDARAPGHWTKPTFRMASTSLAAAIRRFGGLS